MNLFLLTSWAAFLYVTSDPFFWPSMTFTTLIGIFIGSVIYDGDVEQIRKAIIMLSSYVIMIILVTLTRVIDDITPSITQGKPFAGLITISIVTFFYLIGMLLGVVITKMAHKERII